MIFITPE